MVKLRLLLVLSVAALCLTATPARADLYGFQIDNAHSHFDVGTGILTMNLRAGSSGNMQYSGSTAVFNWPSVPWDFTVSMGITPLTSPFPGLQIASATGAFKFTDADSTPDWITGSITGYWTQVSPSAIDFFGGTLSNVLFTDNDVKDKKFNGNTSGFVLMPMLGTTGTLTASITATWFDHSFDVNNGQINGNVAAVPVPAAVLLGFLGLGVAGLKLRKLA